VQQKRIVAVFGRRDAVFETFVFVFRRVEAIAPGLVEKGGLATAKSKVSSDHRPV